MSPIPFAVLLFIGEPSTERSDRSMNKTFLPPLLLSLGGGASPELTPVSLRLRRGA